MGKVWTLQDVKSRFSAVVEAAQRGEPRHVTRRGVDAVVVISAGTRDACRQVRRLNMCLLHDPYVTSAA